jgi:hypothetical protein
MRHSFFIRRSLGLGAVLAAFAAAPAQATAALDTSMCSAGEFSQPFLSYNDTNWYTPLPGESFDSFDGSGWELSGGATVQATTLADGTTGTVLDLPSGSRAVSPTVCVTSFYPTARTMVRNVAGFEGVLVYVSYAGTNTWNNPQVTGQVHGSSTAWTLSRPVQLQPESTPGWQPMRITLAPAGKTGESQIYNLYLDPRMS